MQSCFIFLIIFCIFSLPYGSKVTFDSVRQANDLSPLKFVVPDVVHQIYDYNVPNFFLFLSIQSIQYYLKPEKHILWINIEGKHKRGAWENWLKNTQNGSWEYKLYELVENKKLQVEFLTFPSSPPGNSSIWTNNRAHKSDFVRMQVLKEQGGMYIDTDAYITSSAFHLLRIHDFVVSFDNIVNPPDSTLPKRMNNGILFSKPNALFLDIWMEKYKRFNPQSFDYDSSVVPYELSIQYPDLVHVEQHRISPISFAFQTATFANALTCGLYLPPKDQPMGVPNKANADKTTLEYHIDDNNGGIWYPKFNFAKKAFSFDDTTVDYYMLEQLHKRLALHLTMSQVRGICMMRKNLASPKDLDFMPSFLGHLFRMAYYGYDDFSYLHNWYNTSVAEKNELWKSCRDHFGMHMTPDADDNSRQQYISNIHEK